MADALLRASKLTEQTQPLVPNGYDGERAPEEEEEEGWQHHGGWTLGIGRGGVTAALNR